ncbi:MAG: DUF4465 domain-containing protein [Bacteroidales bacterium]
MKKQLTFFLHFLLTIILMSFFTSCSKDDDINSELYFEGNISELNVPAAGYTQTMKIYSDSEWEILNSSSWLTITPESAANNQEITIIATPNLELADRSSKFSISLADGSKTLEITVKQATGVKVITFESEEYQSVLAGPTSYGENLYSTYVADDTYILYNGVTDINTGIGFDINLSIPYGGTELAKNFYNGGFAISQWNIFTKDPEYMNQCSVISGDEGEKNGGYNKSATFAVEYGIDTITTAEPLIFDHLYVNNSSYAYISMKDGTDFTAAFSKGSWFKVIFTGLKLSKGGYESMGTVEFFLANYKSDETVPIKDWTKVDLSSLGKIDGLAISYDGSDKGMFGINTPLYVCIDNIAIIQ